MTVFVVQESIGKNLSPAAQYGELDVLLSAHKSAAYSLAPTIRTLRNKLRNFNDEDYLLLIGDPLAMAMASVIAAQFNGGKIKILKWNNKDHVYLPLSLNFNVATEVV